MMKCEQCGKEHIRRRFCSDKCKDTWHNIHNPRGFQSRKDPDDEHEDVDPALHGATAGWDEDGWR